jgi:hypothetical protein
LLSVRRILAVAAIFSGTFAHAQLSSDSVPRHRLVPRDEQIRQDLANSRLRLGPIRVQPRFLLRDLGYNNNVYGTPDNPVSDWTTTVAAGAHFTLPFGPKAYLVGNAVPEYTYYEKLTERRFFGGTYDASAVALFNRLSLEATAGTTRGLGIVSSELEAPVVLRTTRVAFDGEIDVFKRLSLFGHVETQRPRYESEPTDQGDLGRVRELDRNDAAVRGGIRYRFSSSFDFAVGAERTESKFESTTLRNNQSEALLFSVHYNRPRAYLNLTVGNRQWKPAEQSVFPRHEAPTGSYFASYALAAPLEFQLHGRRAGVYALAADAPFFMETRNGATLMLRAGNRIRLRAFGETGENDYDVLETRAAAVRNDSVVTYGGGISFRLYRSAGITVQVSQSEYDSNSDSFDRSIMRVQALLSVGDFAR